MANHVERYEIPTNLGQALKALHREGDRAAAIAGGTVLKRPSRIKVLVDLMRCGMEGVKATGKRLQIGATTTAGTLACAEELDRFGAVALREAAAAVSAQAVRNQVTVGGNLVGTASWADLPVALSVLDVQVRSARHGGKRRVFELADLLAGHPAKILHPGELVTSVEMKQPRASRGSAFIKISRTVSDLALVSAAVSMRVEEGACRDVRIAVGSVRSRAARATAAEKALEGAPNDPETFEHAAHLATDKLKVLADARAGREYRRRVLAVAIRRALGVAFDRACGHTTYAPPRRPPPPPWPRHAPGPEVGHTLTVTVDGTARIIPISPDDVLRREGVTSVKRGCDEGYCGTCAVLVDGRLLNACLLLAPQVEGCTITTAAGIGTVFEPHPIQTALVEEGAVQCGFCTPGWVVATKSLLEEIPDPSYEEICAAMDGNLCRCTGYVKPLAAVGKAAEVLRSST